MVREGGGVSFCMGLIIVDILSCEVTFVAGKGVDARDPALGSSRSLGIDPYNIM